GEAVIVVALLADRDPEIEVLVGAVRHRLAQVPGVAGGSQQRAGDAKREQLLLRQWADSDEPVEHDLVAVEQVVVLIDSARHSVAELLDLRLPAGGDVLDHAADLEVTRVHALAGAVLEE